jgi:hypothetical protein
MLTITTTEALTLVAAVITAGFMSVFGFPFRHYMCWYSWNRAGTVTGIVLYLLTAGVGGGLLGWAAAYLSGAEPTVLPDLNGVLFGLAGAVATRADFKSGPKRRFTNSPELRDAASALGFGITWISQLLDTLARHQAEQWYTNLPDSQLIQQAVRLQSHINARPRGEIENGTKKKMIKNLTATLMLLKDPETVVQARTQLTTYCSNIAVGEHVPRVRKFSQSTQPVPSAS